MIFIHVTSESIPGLTEAVAKLALEAGVLDVHGLHVPGYVGLEAGGLVTLSAAPEPRPSLREQLHPLADHRIKVCTNGGRVQGKPLAVKTTVEDLAKIYPTSIF